MVKMELKFSLYHRNSFREVLVPSRLFSSVYVALAIMWAPVGAVRNRKKSASSADRYVPFG